MAVPYVMFTADWQVNGFNIGHKWGQYIRPGEEAHGRAGSENLIGWWMHGGIQRGGFGKLVVFRCNKPFGQKRNAAPPGNVASFITLTSSSRVKSTNREIWSESCDSLDTYSFWTSGHRVFCSRWSSGGGSTGTHSGTQTKAITSARTWK